MKRPSKAISALAAMYELFPNKPENATAALKKLRRAMTRIDRQNFNKVLARIERDYRQEWADVSTPDGGAQ